MESMEPPHLHRLFMDLDSYQPPSRSRRERTGSSLTENLSRSGQRNEDNMEEALAQSRRDYEADRQMMAGTEVMCRCGWVVIDNMEEALGSVVQSVRGMVAGTEVMWVWHWYIAFISLQAQRERCWCPYIYIYIHVYMCIYCGPKKLNHTLAINSTFAVGRLALPLLSPETLPHRVIKDFLYIMCTLLYLSGRMRQLWLHKIIGNCHLAPWN